MKNGAAEIVSLEERAAIDQLALNNGGHSGEPGALLGLNPESEPFKLYTELEAAMFFARRHRDKLRFCRAVGWMVWDGRRWGEDRPAARRLAYESVVAIAHTMDKNPILRERKECIAFAISCQKNHVIKSIMELAQSLEHIVVTEQALDSEPYLFNVRNGTLDLRTGNLRAHDRYALLTKLAEVKFDPDATAPRWEQFLQEIFDGDHETVNFVQRAIGYSLTADTREQCFLMLWGNGANGKSTLLNVLGHLLGDYGTSASTETFIGRKAGIATNDLARLRGARFVTAVETTEGHALAESFVKAVTGGDSMPVRFHYQEHFLLRPQFKLWIGVNHKPLIRGTDEGIWRRPRLIPFEQRFQGSRCDKELESNLVAELPGILAWAVRGCLIWQREGLGDSPAVRDATAFYREDSDVLAKFMAETCVRGPTYVEGSTALFEAWRKWAEANNEAAGTQKALAGQLKERGFETGRNSKGQTIWKGIGLVAREQEHEPSEVS